MARKHWTQGSQMRRPAGKAISDESPSGTWQRGGGGKEYTFLAWTTPKKYAKVFSFQEIKQMNMLPI